jgi:hypothetical protein
MKINIHGKNYNIIKRVKLSAQRERVGLYYRLYMTRGKKHYTVEMSDEGQINQTPVEVNYPLIEAFL